MADVGRAARLRVQRQLGVARHGVELLERKQRIVAAEHERLLLRSDGLGEAWGHAARAALEWAERAAALDGWDAIDAASPLARARVTITEGHVMGVDFPDDAAVDVPPRRPTGAGASVSYAAEAMAHAVRAAAIHAATRRAAATVAQELYATRTRRRAVEHRWVPHLESELTRIERALDELEREENLRVRWAVGAQEQSRPAHARPAEARTGGA
ncbi:V-type ATP synthase subunit D [Demequina capsici]|uniref:V-type ATP synthase subunit D n=1 Tax=Demequina capsici TaxID=3075620 RepID=A0AA96F7U1_9MICO|nr:V-type ATP synthase subunit D [Demequina sp. OYTSA14]WNM24982.1 V-type ATP synthase subunit D [Demequina sp. OYTSA14]